jgi:hypothetical protein
MVKKGDKFIFNGESFSYPLYDPIHIVKKLDLVIAEKYDSPYIHAYVNKLGVSSLFLADPLDLIPYEDFPEDDLVDTRSIAFWNRKHKLVFPKAFKSYD